VACSPHAPLPVNPRVAVAPHSGDAGNGEVSNEAPYAHFSWDFQEYWRATNYTCLAANSSAAYDWYIGAMPWDDPETSNITADMKNATMFNSTSGANK
jgi:hypothetical protein